MKQRDSSGFSLAELLIVLALLGVAATFAVPKLLLSNQQDSRYRALAKDAITMIAAAYSTYQLSNTPDATTRISDLTPYMNYVRQDSTGSVDRPYGQTGEWYCDGSTNGNCLRLHNGMTLAYWSGSGGSTGNYFGQAQPNHYIYFILDPDGRLTSPGSTNGPGKSLDMVLFFDGRIGTYDICQATDVTYQDGVPNSWCNGTAINPPWFHWN